MKWYLKVLQNYANFNGRARRKEYWFFVLFNILVGILVSLIDDFFGLTLFKLHSPLGLSQMEPLDVGILHTFYQIAIIIPSIAVFVRRLHDIGKGGQWFFYWILITFAWAIVSVVILIFTNPLIYMSLFYTGLLVIAIWQLVWLCTEGESGDNRFGPDPKLEDIDPANNTEGDHYLK
jgi:uncharacterized membrane protein YhaH (DUF805 family)